jgi:hypothetical protein
MTPIDAGSWIRSPRRNLGFALPCAALLALLTVMLLAVASRLGTGGVEGVVWLATASFLFAMASLTARLMIGWARAGLLLRDHVVIVRGPWTTRRLTRARIERFEAGMQRTLVGNPIPGVVIRLGDGSAVNVAALASESMVTVAALNELLTKARN